MEALMKNLNAKGSLDAVKLKKTTTTVRQIIGKAYTIGENGEKIQVKKRRKKKKAKKKKPAYIQKYLIYFVCTSNTCRSPMCVGLARDHVKQNNYPFEIRSFGVWACDGDTASLNSVKILRKLGLDISEHRSTSINSVDFEDKFLKIICMEQWQKDDILQYRIPAINENNVILLTEDEVPDPIGGNMAEYVGVFDFLRPHIAKHLDSLARTLNIAAVDTIENFEEDLAQNETTSDVLQHAEEREMEIQKEILQIRDEMYNESKKNFSKANDRFRELQIVNDAATITDEESDEISL